MQPERFATTATGLFFFAVYFAVSLSLLCVFSLVYAKITPYREFQLIREGNTAAAYSFGGALLGFAIPLASVVAHSAGLLDMVVWGIIAMIVQLITFFAVRRVFPEIVSDIPANQVSKGIFLATVSLAAGILNAACITY